MSDPRADHADTPRSLPLSPATVPERTDPTDDSLYARAGGESFFHALVDAFYGRVAVDPTLRPLYPDADLSAANLHLRLFLIQYWGGPTTYSQTRGHPRLRMRHAPFPVGEAQITAWLQAMHGALEEMDPPDDIAAELWAYFERAAPFLRNTDA
ncbi:MAG: globin [Euzebya sp.]